LTAAILAGEFPAGTLLPPAAKLQIRFNACFRTVRRALASLEHDRVIDRSGGRYKVPLAGSSRSSLEVVFFNEGASEINEGFNAMIQMSEQHVSRLGMRLTRFEHSYSEPFDSIELHRVMQRDSVAGCLLDMWGTGTPDREKNFISLLTTLYSIGKPLVIMDHVGDFEPPEPLRSSKRAMVVAIAGRVAGEDVGRYLIGAGHRRIAFIAPTFEQDWSRRRLAGVKRAVTSSGLDESAVSEHRGAPLMGVSPIVCAVAGLSRSDMLDLFTPNLREEEVDQLIERRPALAQQLRMGDDDIARTRALADMALALGRFGPFAGRLRADINEFIGIPFHPRFHKPVLQPILADRSVTAWVCATDGIGFAVMSFLRSESVPMPERVSVVGFDNSLTATALNFSSYDFDLAGRINHALAFVTGRAGSAKTRSVLEWPGRIIERKSSGKAPVPQVR
jgi:DNA-binding LacI/PurR family transcriptional regulator